MTDRLIFPTSIEQIGTSELVHTYFPLAKWTNVFEKEPFATYYISDIELDVAPATFFEWAYQTPSGHGPVLFYCLNLSIQFIVEPTGWMLEIVTRLRGAPKQLTDGV